MHVLGRLAVRCNAVQDSFDNVMFTEVQRLLNAWMLIDKDLAAPSGRAKVLLQARQNKHAPPSFVVT